MRIPEWFKSDGASLPRFYRKYIIRRHGQETMNKIDESGRLHDFMAYNHPFHARYNRIIFKQSLEKQNIPRYLINQLIWGLKFYDCSPVWLKVLLKKTT